jgi:parallel beta-helix repeat protein/predicted outer membrane repeat protein
VPGDFPSIQLAIGSATTADGDTIVVAPGTYVETIDFLGKTIVVRSAQGPSVTTLDGSGNGSVVTFQSGEGPDSVLQGFTIRGGSADIGGGIRIVGGASPTVADCAVSGNTATLRGGGIYAAGSPTIHNCRIGANAAETGGGMYIVGGKLTIINCTFSGNVATGSGGGIYSIGATPVLFNCTLSENSASFTGGIRADDGQVTVRNSILWNNVPGAFGGTALRVVTYSDVQGGHVGAGNINAHPLFVDAAGPDDTPGTADDDLRLQLPSPCIDAGQNAAYVFCAPDLDGNARQFDDPGAPGCPQGAQCGSDPIIDMGPYEHASRVPTPDCNADVLDDACEIAFGLVPDCNANGVPDECDIAAGTSADCNANDVPDECDVAAGQSADCDGNDMPDECQVLHVLESSGALGPIGAGSPQSFTVAPAPQAGPLVTLSFTAVGDFGGSTEWVDVSINGTSVGIVFDLAARDCPVLPDADQIVLQGVDFNELLTGPNAVVTMTASAGVDPALCSSSIAVTVEYQALTPSDANGDGEIDECQAAVQCPWDLEPPPGVVGISELLTVLAAWGSSPAGGPDLDGDGVVGIGDLLVLLSNWGPCPS